MLIKRNILALCTIGLFLVLQVVWICRLPDVDVLQNDDGYPRRFEIARQTTILHTPNSTFPKAKCLNQCNHAGKCVMGQCICSKYFHGNSCENVKTLQGCVNNCTDRGACVNGICSCQYPWRGIDCSTSIQDPFHIFLERIAVRSIVAVTLVNKGFAPSAVIWSQRLKRMNMTNHFVLVLDSGAEEIMQIASVPYFRAPDVLFFQNVSTDSEKYGSPEYFSILENKPRLTLEILKRGYHALVSDADTIWLKSPESLIQSPCGLSIATDSKNFDYCQKLSNQSKSECIHFVAYDLSPSLFLAKSDPEIVYFYEILSSMLQVSDLHDQPLFNYVISKYRFRKTGILVLDPIDYPSGLRYFIQKLPQSRGTIPVVVHNNWLARGIEAKMHRLKEFNLLTREEVDFIENLTLHPSTSQAAQAPTLVIPTLTGSCQSILSFANLALLLSIRLEIDLAFPIIDCGLCACSPMCYSQVRSFISPPCYIHDILTIPKLPRTTRLNPSHKSDGQQIEANCQIGSDSFRKLILQDIGQTSSFLESMKSKLRLCADIALDEEINHVALWSEIPDEALSTLFEFL
eukprot:TRINITY_DN3144_c0_g1_i6.p1 TRINITY_DN3144_c0_g1~~TRINITY_DN3144_c0_g1_i6.p1  ORF type:complete len:573 (-),score=103.51 TRINITY_DN3144_c0_g1_i6:736-2454(-)